VGEEIGSEIAYRTLRSGRRREVRRGEDMIRLLLPR
jgi:hypothetical protein